MVLGVGLLVREAFSFWTGHPYDFEVWIRTGYEVAHGTNPYDGFWPAVPGVSFSFLSQTLTSAAYLPFWSGLLGGLYRFWEAVGGGNRFALYFLLKQPGILADIATAYLLCRLVQRWTSNGRAAAAVLSFWALFPYAIAITAIWGQFDSIVVMVLLALLYVRDPLERNLVNGVGIFVKWLTVIFLPLEFLRERGLRRLGVLVALAVPLVLTVTIFVIAGWSFSQVVPLATSQSSGDGLGMNLAFPLSLGAVVGALSSVPHFYTVIPYAWVPGVILAGVVAARWVRANEPRAELRAMLLIVSVFLLLRWGLYEQVHALPVLAGRPGRRGVPPWEACPPRLHDRAVGGFPPREQRPGTSVPRAGRFGGCGVHDGDRREQRLGVRSDGGPHVARVPDRGHADSMDPHPRAGRAVPPTVAARLATGTLSGGCDRAWHMRRPPHPASRRGVKTLERTPRCPPGLGIGEGSRERSGRKR